MFLLLISVVVAIIWYINKRHFSYWKKLGVSGPKPLLFVGNIGYNIIGKKSVSEIFGDIYTKYEGLPFVGAYRTLTPCLILRDAELIKNITVRDFKYFIDNDNYVDKNVDPLFGRHPFVLKGLEWKHTRSQLTPSFTSGKMKVIFPLIENVSKDLLTYIKNLKNKNNVNIKEMCTRFTCDNVAVCGFGIRGKCLDEPSSEFRDLADRFMSPNSWQGIILSMSLTVPLLSRLLPLKLVSKYVEGRLTAMVKATIKYREENDIARNDFLDSLYQISKNTPSFTMVDVVAHSAGFFLDGFETSSVVMSFVLFDLAMNQECQNKLRNEINSVLERRNGKLSYEALQEMTYLDACISESLRLHPPSAHLGKICTQPYTITGNDGSKELSVVLEPGTTIILPVMGLHMDPKHFTEPEKFYPDRFLDKENINKYVYLPFGEGPRRCLGQRFGLLQIKMGIMHVIQHYQISVNKSMQLPLKHLPFYLLLFPKDGFRLDFQEI